MMNGFMMYWTFMQRRWRKVRSRVVYQRSRGVMEGFRSRVQEGFRCRMEYGLRR
jgi:hypothetical protein